MYIECKNVRIRIFQDLFKYMVHGHFNLMYTHIRCFDFK